MRAIANKKIRAWLTLVLASAGLALISSTASAAPVTIDLCAKDGTATLTGSDTAPIWGFALKPADLTMTGDTTDTSTTISNLTDTTGLLAGMVVEGDGIPAGATIVSVDSISAITISDAATATATGVSLTFSTPCTHSSVVPQLPGPVLTLNDGDTVTLNVTNALPTATAPLHRISIEIPGVSFDPPSNADADVDQTASVTFTADAPGTYLYESAGDGGRQEAMGLYGALIVRPSTAGQAYDDGSTAYDVEATLVLSQVDVNFNANPDTFNMLNYVATYWLINGKAYPDTSSIAAAAGQKVLLRYLNAGYDNTTMALLGMHQTVLARDASLLNNPFDADAETIPAGATEDGIATVPGFPPPSSNGFALYNRQLHLTNGDQTGTSPDPVTGGGMITFIQP